MTRFALHWLDVFTDRPFAGNPLAVVPEADDLTDAQMQAIARELGLSETTFVQDGARRLRIFTPATELPLAGHPVVGAAVCLVELGRIPASGTHVFQTGAGAVPVDVDRGVATMTQGPLEAGDQHEAGAVAAMLRLPVDELDGAPRFASTTGIRQLFARVRDRATLARIKPDTALIAADEAIDGLVAWCEDGAELTQRAFLPRLGIAEDPATGSAAGALAALRVLRGGEPGAVLVRQGAEVGRPSEIEVSVAGTAGAPAPPRVGGRGVPVLEGALLV